MKNAVSYIGSFIICIFLVFTLIGSAVCFTAEKYENPDTIIALTEKKDIKTIVYNELNKYYKERYAVTGIPENVFMDSIDTDYLQECINRKIRAGISELDYRYVCDSTDIMTLPEQKAVEESIHEYFRQYAEETGYEIKGSDDVYFKKLKQTQENAVKITEEYSDVFKFSALSKHGVTAKIKPYAEKLSVIRIICLGISAFLALLLLVFNFKAFRHVLYWIGISALSAGVLGSVPCLYLLKIDYFSSFTIKQPQIYAAYTGIMKEVTENFLTYSVILAASGIVLIIFYGIVCSVMKKASDNSAEKGTAV